MLNKIKEKYEKLNGKSEEVESIQIILIAIAIVGITVLATNFIESLMII